MTDDACLWTGIHCYPHVIHECNDRWSFLKRRTFLSQQGSKLLKIKWRAFIPHQQAVTSTRQNSLFQAVYSNKKGQCWKLKILPRIISKSDWRRNKPFKSKITKQANEKIASKQGKSMYEGTALGREYGFWAEEGTPHIIRVGTQRKTKSFVSDAKSGST